MLRRPIPEEPSRCVAAQTDDCSPAHSPTSGLPWEPVSWSSRGVRQTSRHPSTAAQKDLTVCGHEMPGMSVPPWSVGQSTSSGSPLGQRGMLGQDSHLERVLLGPKWRNVSVRSSVSVSGD